MSTALPDARLPRGTFIAGPAGNNLFVEFWPDVINAWHRHKQHADWSGMR
jgi:hypothetical protein